MVVGKMQAGSPQLYSLMVACLVSGLSIGSLLSYSVPGAWLGNCCLIHAILSDWKAGKPVKLAAINRTARTLLPVEAKAGVENLSHEHPELQGWGPITCLLALPSQVGSWFSLSLSCLGTSPCDLKVVVTALFQNIYITSFRLAPGPLWKSD